MKGSKAMKQVKISIEGRHYTACPCNPWIARIKRAMTISSMLCMILTLPAHATIGIKENSIITDNTIKLGDIFYGLEYEEDRILGAAPHPGDDMILDARTLLRVAKAVGLDWRPTSNEQKVRISRKATVISKEIMNSRIKEALQAKGVYGDYALQIPARYQEIILPYDQSASLDITDLSVDTAHKNYTATIAAPSADNPIQNFTISGTIQPVVKVPVLLENMARGNIITEKDIHLIKIPETEFTRNTIGAAEELIGMSPRRLVAAGRPIQFTDLVAPQIISRGELVTILLNNGPLSLSTQVKALESGAKGDIIRVVNISSNQALQAQIIGKKQVAVISN